MKRTIFTCFLVLVLAGLAPMYVQAQRLQGDEQDLFDKFIFNWIDSEKNLDEALMGRSFNSLMTTRRRLNGGEKTFFDNFLINWASSERAFDENALTKSFTTLSATRNKYSGAEQALYEKFVLGWVGGSGTVNPSASGGRGNRNKGTEDKLISSFNTLSATRGRFAADVQPLFDKYVIAWVGSGKDVDEVLMVRTLNTILPTRNQLRGAEQAFFDSFLVQWIGSSSRKADQAEIVKAFQAVNKDRSSRRG